jgi:hypothetical protein
METAHIQALPLRMIDITSSTAFLHQMHHAETVLGLAAVLHWLQTTQIFSIYSLEVRLPPHRVLDLVLSRVDHL